MKTIISSFEVKIKHTLQKKRGAIYKILIIDVYDKNKNNDGQVF
jgi:hypothetical protein